MQRAVVRQEPYGGAKGVGGEEEPVRVLPQPPARRSGDRHLVRSRASEPQPGVGGHYVQRRTGRRGAEPDARAGVKQFRVAEVGRVGELPDVARGPAGHQWLWLRPARLACSGIARRRPRRRGSARLVARLVGREHEGRSGFAAQCFRVSGFQSVGHAHQQHARLLFGFQSHLDAQPAHLAGSEQVHRQALGVHSAQKRRVATEFVSLHALGFKPNRATTCFSAVEGEGDIDCAAQGLARRIVQHSAELHPTRDDGSGAGPASLGGRRNSRAGSGRVHLHRPGYD